MFYFGGYIIHKLILTDREVFYFINNKIANPIFDFIFYWIRQPYFWPPVYIFLIGFIVLNFKNGWAWVLFLMVTVSLCDLFGTHLFKHVFMRVRPCNNLLLLNHVRLLLPNCSNGYSFISNHAANHFGMASFIYYTLKYFYGNKMAIFFIWAALISIAQIYVGVHYPLDVVGGIIVGMGIGVITSKLFCIQFPNFKQLIT